MPSSLLRGATSESLSSRAKKVRRAAARPPVPPGPALWVRRPSPTYSLTPRVPAINGQAIRSTLFTVLNEYNGRGTGFFQSRPVLRETARRLEITREADEQALLTAFHDCFLQGLVAWGCDVANPDPPFMHFTERGREVLKHLSRDPSNPDGYRAYLAARGGLNPVAASYVDEALRTYGAACWKATAVMLGAAAESLALELRDVLVDRLATLGRAGPRDLKDWRAKRVLDAVQQELKAHARAMGAPLGEAFEAYWPAFTQQLRAARNDAGHPASVDPVTPEAVHAGLLVFPELAGLAAQLRGWVAASMP